MARLNRNFSISFALVSAHFAELDVSLDRFGRLGESCPHC
jgi:hypothetical protein